jgi:hypothetical protein
MKKNEGNRRRRRIEKSEVAEKKNKERWRRKRGIIRTIKRQGERKEK